MSNTTKKYIVSSLVTFLAAFGYVVLQNIDNVTIEALSNGAVLGILFSALRAGVKALLEFFLAK